MNPLACTRYELEDCTWAMHHMLHDHGIELMTRMLVYELDGYDTIILLWHNELIP
jgi:hypothetical protein